MALSVQIKGIAPRFVFMMNDTKKPQIPDKIIRFPFYYGFKTLLVTSLTGDRTRGVESLLAFSLASDRFPQERNIDFVVSSSFWFFFSKTGQVKTLRIDMGWASLANNT